VDLLLGLRGMDPELLNRTRQVRLGEATLAIVGREDFIAMIADRWTCNCCVGWRRASC
jgi:hypothetical protein